MCQCPKSGFFHFYLPELEIGEVVEINGVNALSRASSISTKPFTVCTQLREWVCQCPKSGFFHFYKLRQIEKEDKTMCQCPKSGFFHFYSASLEPP